MQILFANAKRRFYSFMELHKIRSKNSRGKNLIIVPHFSYIDYEATALNLLLGDFNSKLVLF